MDHNGDKNKPTKLVILSHPAVYPGWGLNMLPLGPFSMEAQGGSIYCRNWKKNRPRQACGMPVYRRAFLKTSFVMTWETARDKSS